MTALTPARGKPVVFHTEFWLKGCPKCHGDLVVDSDEYGQFVKCMQCGWQKDVDVAVAELPEKAMTRPPNPDRRQRRSNGGRHRV